MRIEYHLDNGNEKITNFSIAEAVVDFCEDNYHDPELNAEVVAKMILLQIDSIKEMRSDINA